jgi:hypothetical protein
MEANLPLLGYYGIVKKKILKKIIFFGMAICVLIIGKMVKNKISL